MDCEPNSFALDGKVSIALDESSTVTSEVRSIVHPSSPFHRSTLQAFQNALGDPPQVSNIIGFGTPGVIFTGSGSDRDMDEAKYISNNNLEHVESWFRSQRPNTAVKVALCGCDTGAGERGQHLLARAADALGIEIAAPTGFVFVDSKCRQLYLEPGATWVSATPTRKPAVINPPNPQPDDPPPSDIVLFTPADDEHSLPVAHKLSAKSVQRVHYFGRATQFYSPWSDMRALGVLPFLHLDAPFIASPLTLAVATGRLSVTTAELGQRSFRVLNRRLIQDTLVPSVYYYVNLDVMLSAML
jgi:hypothetical protein